MKRLLVFGVVVLGLMLGATPAYAAGAFTQTIHIDTLKDAIPVTCAGPFTGLTIINATGNGVVHFNANSTGDWFTTTFEGQGTIVQTSGPLAGQVFTGHVMEWVGDEGNLQNSVFHATFNFDGTNATGQSLGMHAQAEVVMNANGTFTVRNVAVSCR
jgi:hypothetical protein